MSTTQSQSDNAVIVCIDFKNPKAYLAKDPTFALEDELHAQFDWQPLLLAPLTRPAPMSDGEDRGTRHRRIRAEYNERDHRRYGRRAGLHLGDLYRNPDASVACIGLLWSKIQSRRIARDYIDRVFAQYWAEQLDIADPAAIGNVLRDVGADVVGWENYVTTTGRTALADVQRALKDAGVFDVPAYILNGDVFLGRQHLPMLRWILTDKVGEPPL